MATTTFVNGTTLSDEDWFNDLDRLHYDILNDPADIAAIRTALVAPMTWTTPTFDAANFTAEGSQTWTVAAGDVTTYAYTIMNKVMVVVFNLITTSVGGTPDTALDIAIPASKTSTKEIWNPVYIFDGGSASIGVAKVNAGGTKIYILRADSANWTGSTNTTQVRGQITFEIN